MGNATLISCGGRSGAAEPDARCGCMSSPGSLVSSPEATSSVGSGSPGVMLPITNRRKRGVKLETVYDEGDTTTEPAEEAEVEACPKARRNPEACVRFNEATPVVMEITPQSSIEWESSPTKAFGGASPPHLAMKTPKCSGAKQLSFGSDDTEACGVPSES
mmetsp:Transcript_60097/g.152516  ORF Transcript_60097/g.152516 Transcript_60097/m.152516 type:complete len:161 (-) Transcript_60097:84-566(-)|eukprot:CAMPEP_0183445598 /NCGR_PEP_ID=MMETSP0370-20130417/96411_1 /TAXON_ID=268820 /ORGANISM="Peridinium aciculiferum, Strain PAER-2" /LENGTH=160 /DNA_ID=CAMNT_0025636193 /DNA_START=123 /DNA_END=605 /DNA_ORIENTATION=+